MFQSLLQPHSPPAPPLPRPTHNTLNVSFQWNGFVSCPPCSRPYIWKDQSCRLGWCLSSADIHFTTFNSIHVSGGWEVSKYRRGLGMTNFNSHNWPSGLVQVWRCHHDSMFKINLRAHTQQPRPPPPHNPSHKPGLGPIAMNLSTLEAFKRLI